MSSILIAALANVLIAGSLAAFDRSRGDAWGSRPSRRPPQPVRVRPSQVRESLPRTSPRPDRRG